MNATCSKSKLGRLAAAVLLVLGLASGCSAPAPVNHTATSDNQMVLRQAMRKLWEDHVTMMKEHLDLTLSGIIQQFPDKF